MRLLSKILSSVHMIKSSPVPFVVSDPSLAIVSNAWIVAAVIYAKNVIVIDQMNMKVENMFLKWFVRMEQNNKEKKSEKTCFCSDSWGWNKTIKKIKIILLLDVHLWWSHVPIRVLTRDCWLIVYKILCLAWSLIHDRLAWLTEPNDDNE